MDKISITFNLKPSGDQKEISVPLLISRGYKREQVTLLLEELQAKGFGTFNRGSRGRTKVGKFIPNELCPESYTMEFVKKTIGRPKSKIG